MGTMFNGNEVICTRYRESNRCSRYWEAQAGTSYQWNRESVDDSVPRSRYVACLAVGPEDAAKVLRPQLWTLYACQQAASLSSYPRAQASPTRYATKCEFMFHAHLRRPRDRRHNRSISSSLPSTTSAGSRYLTAILKRLGPWT